MKKQVLLIALLFILSGIIGCSTKKKPSIEYLPCQTEIGGDWGFVNYKGDVVLDDYFEKEPSIVKDGIFSVLEPEGTYSLYKFDVQKPIIICDGLSSVGLPNDGFLPICKKGDPIEIVDIKGHKKFSLEKICNKYIVSCFSSFLSGYLVVFTEDLCAGLIDSKGNTILKPKYDMIFPLDKNHIIVIMEKTPYMVNSQGDICKQWESNELEEYLYEFGEKISIWRQPKYLAIPGYDDKGKDYYCIYDLDHHLIYKWIRPSYACQINDIITDNNFLFGRENQYGVMSLQGEKILRDKYTYIHQIPGVGYVASRNNSDYELFNDKGEFLTKFEDFGYVTELFFFIAINSEGLYFIDETLTPIKSRVRQLGTSTTASLQHMVYSDIKTPKDQQCVETINNLFVNHGFGFDYSIILDSMSNYLTKRFIKYAKKIMSSGNCYSIDKDVFWMVDRIVGIELQQSKPDLVQPFRAVENAYRAEWYCEYDVPCAELITCNYFVMKEEDGIWKIDNFIIKTSENPNPTNKLAINY